MIIIEAEKNVLKRWRGEGDEFIFQHVDLMYLLKHQFGDNFRLLDMCFWRSEKGIGYNILKE